MQKKPIKKVKPTPEYDSERETRVLLEEVASDVKKVAEQVGSNSLKLMKLDKIEEDVAELKSELGTVKIVVRENSTKIDRVEKKLDTVTTNHEKRIKKLEVIR